MQMQLPSRISRLGGTYVLGVSFSHPPRGSFRNMNMRMRMNSMIGGGFLSRARLLRERKLERYVDVLD